MTPFLEIVGVRVGYGAQIVLKGIDLAVAKGELVALLGASGCGKTTLLRAVCGFLPAEAGRILVDGRDITGVPPERRDMAMVFQSYALWPHMTAGQNIGYGLKLRRRPKVEIRERVGRILDLLGLTGMEDRPVGQLSGGQRQRVALGRALAIDPSILLLDEPLSNLDAKIRQQVRHDIKGLQKKLGITAMLVTHDREEAMIMADRVVLLNDGLIAQAGTPEEVFNAPVSPFVAGFMGADNVVRLEVRRADGVIEVLAGPDNEPARLASVAARVRGLPATGRVQTHFRGEAATLVATDALALLAPAERLVLRGAIEQQSYPGGFFRYAVRVGDTTYLVDDEKRFAVGDRVGVLLPAESLHFYPADNV